jgi:hypothetical protein
MKLKTKVLVILDGHGLTKKEEFYNLNEINHDYYFFNDLGKGLGFATLSNHLYDLVSQNYTFQFKEFERYEYNNKETKLNKHYLKKFDNNQLFNNNNQPIYDKTKLFTSEFNFPINQTLNLRQIIEKTKQIEKHGLKEVSAYVQINNKPTSILVQYTKHPEIEFEYRFVYVKLGQASSLIDLMAIDKDVISKFESFGDTLNYNLDTTSQNIYNYDEVIVLWGACRNYDDNN